MTQRTSERAWKVLSEVRSYRSNLTPNGGKIRIQARSRIPTDRLTELRDEILSLRDELLSILTSDPGFFPTSKRRDYPRIGTEDYDRESLYEKWRICAYHHDVPAAHEAQSQLRVLIRGELHAELKGKEALSSYLREHWHEYERLRTEIEGKAH